MNNEKMEGILDDTTISEQEEIIEKLDDINKTNGKKIDMTNKRIDFDKKALRRLETMLPIYKEEIGKANTSELYSYVVGKAIDNLFENDFKEKLAEL